MQDDFQLLTGGLSARPRPVRPPWSIAEPAFLRVCDRCGDCISACPQQILIRGRGDYPQLDFSSGGCSFCGECLRACHAGGLQNTENPPWNLKAFIAESCLANHETDCHACGEQCPQAAIQFRRQVGNAAMPMLEQSLCNGCGACVAACPVHAIDVLGSIQEGGLVS